MNTKDDGGPAFPTGTQVEQNYATGETVVHQYLSDGISVRDYFAAKAMQGMFAADTAESVMPNINKARLAYVMADEMLKARNA